MNDVHGTIKMSVILQLANGAHRRLDKKAVSEEAVTESQNHNAPPAVMRVMSGVGCLKTWENVAIYHWTLGTCSASEF